LTPEIPKWAIRTKADRLAIEKGCYWDSQAANAITTFAESFFKPQFITGNFNLLLWERRFLQSLYGWKNPDNTRRFKTANLHIAKKNGKTLLVSIICLYELLKSKEPSPFIVSGSVTRENAAQVFNELRHSLTKANLTKHCRITAFQKKISVPAHNAEYRSLSSDGDSQQGLNASLVVVDEAHAHKNAGLYDSLKYATAARPNGLMILISTAGDDVSHWYHQVYSKSKRLIAGEDTDTTHYAEVYETDQDSDLTDPIQWRKANPSMDVSFSEAQFRREMEACTDPAEMNRFYRYRLNKWVRSDETAYFDVSHWDKARAYFTDEYLKHCPCYIGIDCSQTTDPSSIACLFALPDGDFFVRSYAFVAKQGVLQREKTTFPRYQQFAQEGWMTITDGDRIDDILIFKTLKDLTTTYQVESLTFDPTSAMILMGLMEREGCKVYRMPQSTSYYSAPMKELNKLIIEDRIKHDGSNWLKYCLSNVRADSDHKGAIRPNTKNSLDHIDGAISLLMAYSMAAQSVAIAPSIYETQGILYV
jgi:phage terminase large subunit-like protein